MTREEEDSGYMEEFGEYMVAKDLLKSRAVRQLIENHRDEFEELSGAATRQEVERLQRLVASSLRSIEQLRAANPDGVAVPALTETANALAAENTELRNELRKLQRKVERLEKAKTLEKKADELRREEAGA